MPYLSDDQLLRVPIRYMLPHLTFPEVEEVCKPDHGPTMAQIFKFSETTKGEMYQDNSIDLAGQVQLLKVSSHKPCLNGSD